MAKFFLPEKIVEPSSYDLFTLLFKLDIHLKRTT